MKHSNTLENEIIKYLYHMKNRITSKEQVMVGTYPLGGQSTDDAGTDKMGLPDEQVINNILGYAKALEVLKRASGEPVFFVRN